MLELIDALLLADALNISGSQGIAVVKVLLILAALVFRKLANAKTREA